MHSDTIAHVGMGEKYMTRIFMISLLHLDQFISMIKKQETVGQDMEIRNVTYKKISVGKLQRKRLRGRNSSHNIDCIR